MCAGSHSGAGVASASGSASSSSGTQVISVDYTKMMLVEGLQGYKLSAGPNGFCVADVAGEVKESEVPNATLELWKKNKDVPAAAPKPLSKKGKNKIGHANKKPAGAAKKRPAGALNEEGGDTDADEIGADGAMGGADADGLGEEEEEEEADGETDCEADPEAAKPAKMTYHVEWYKRDHCASIRQNLGAKKQIGTVGKKEDGYSKEEKREVAKDICKLLAAGKITEDKPSLKKKAEELLKKAK